MKLYGALASPYVAKVVMLARAMGLELPMEMPPGGFKSAEHHALHPWGKIPAFEDEFVTLGESEVICEYLLDRFPEKSILPRDPAARARNRLISRAADLYVMGSVAPLISQMNPATRDERLVVDGLARVATALDNFEPLVDETGPFIAGESLTLADCSALAMLGFAQFVLPAVGEENPFEGRPRLQGWWARIQQDTIGGPMLADVTAAIEDFKRRRAAEQG